MTTTATSKARHLRGITWDHPRGLGGVLAASRTWESLHPQVTIEWSARSLQAFADQPLALLVESFDLLVIDHPHIPAAQHLLLPLDGTGHDDELATIAMQTIGESHNSYLHAGRQLGLATDVAAQVSVHRPDLLPEPPQTWDEVRAIGRRGRLLWPAKPVDAISTFMTLCANLGSPVGQRPETFVDRETGLEVLGRMRTLASLVPAACLDANPIEIAEQLSTRDDWVYAPLAFGYTNYSRPGFRPKRLAYRDIPRGEGGLRGSCLGGAGIAVSRTSAQTEAAVDFAVWLASEDCQRSVYYDGGGQPGNARAWDADDLNADSLDFFRGTRATLEASWMRPRLASWLDVQDAVGMLINRALRDDMSDRRCLERAEREYGEIAASDQLGAPAS